MQRVYSFAFLSGEVAALESTRHSGRWAKKFISNSVLKGTLDPLVYQLKGLKRKIGTQVSLDRYTSIK